MYFNGQYSVKMINWPVWQFFTKNAMERLYFNILQKIYRYFSLECIKSFYFKELPSMSTMARIQHLNDLQARATVALGRLTITSMILAISEATVLWGALLCSAPDITIQRGCSQGCWVARSPLAKTPVGRPHTNHKSSWHCGQNHPAKKRSGAQRSLNPPINGFTMPRSTFTYSSALIFSPLVKKLESIMSALLLTTASNITVARNLVVITLGTSEMSEHKHLLFIYILIFWSWEKFFSLEKKKSWPLAAGTFSLLSNILALAILFSFVATFINWPFLNT